MRVGIVGLGSIATKHISALRTIDSDVQIFALRHNPNAKSTDSGVRNVYSYDELLAENLDFVIVSNPTSEHFSTVARLADCNVPLFIEKPLFDKLIPPPEVAAKTYVACNLRFLDCLVFIKKELAGKRINEVNAYCGSYLPDWRPGVDWRKCYSANADMGGGVHIDLIHEIDYLYWLFGKPRNVRKSFRNVSSLNITAYDYANYFMEYDTFSTSVVLNYYRRDYKRTLEILSENHTYFVDLAKNSVLCDGVEVYKSAQTFADTYKSQMKHFLTSTNFNDIAEAYEVLKICLD